MNRDKNGRFTKKNNIEISILSFALIMKYFFLFLIFSLWVYLFIVKFEGLSFIENIFATLSGPIQNEECINKEDKKLYK